MIVTRQAPGFESYGRDGLDWHRWPRRQHWPGRCDRQGGRYWCRGPRRRALRRRAHLLPAHLPGGRLPALGRRAPAARPLRRRHPRARTPLSTTTAAVCLRRCTRSTAATGVVMMLRTAVRPSAHLRAVSWLPTARRRGTPRSCRGGARDQGWRHHCRRHVHDRRRRVHRSVH